MTNESDAEPAAHYVLRLCINGNTPRSARAVVNIRRICEQHLKGCYELAIIDISLHPARASQEQVIAAPTLIKLAPLPQRRFIGDLSQTDRILRGFDLVAR